MVKERNYINKIYKRVAITIFDKFKGEERVNGVFRVEEDFLREVGENACSKLFLQFLLHTLTNGRGLKFNSAFKGRTFKRG